MRKSCLLLEVINLGVYRVSLEDDIVFAQNVTMEAYGWMVKSMGWSHSCEILPKGLGLDPYCLDMCKKLHSQEVLTEPRSDTRTVGKHLPLRDSYRENKLYIPGGKQ